MVQAAWQQVFIKFWSVAAIIHCTLSLGCMKNVLITGIKSSTLHQTSLMSTLYTACDFHLEHDVFQL